MRVDRDTCTDYARSSRLEWLQTNGTGGFAMGTVSGANTRRYHGLLVASLHPPADRYVLVSKIDEEAAAGGREYALATNQYPGAVHPAGYRLLAEFRLAPFPVWTYDLEGLRIEKRVLLLPGEQSVVVEYSASRSCRLVARPLLACRDYHSLTRAGGPWNTAVTEQGPHVHVRPYPELPPVTFISSGAAFQAGGDWYYRFEYLEELERGLDFREDLYCPGAFVFDLGPDRPAWLVAGVAPPARWTFPPECEDPAFEGCLHRAADQFLVRRGCDQPAIVAGYPWFTDWGRDTMISLPGLLLSRGRLAEARRILEGFLEHLYQGLIPNCFPDWNGRPEYNTADAALWMFQAVWAYEQAGGDASFFYPAAREIAERHLRGTLHGIGVDPADGLLAAGGETTNLTWMDARVDGRPVTPRHGKPVEVNALWYNALRMLEAWTRRRGERATVWTRAARQVKASFAAFWNPARDCLYDVLGPSGPDASLRPNQIFAVSLAFSPLARPQQQGVVRAVGEHLLTPFGLRTLAPGEPGYQGRYAGGPAERDRAYHQGTVWPWLLGPYIAAYLRAFGRSRKNLAHCRSLVAAFEPELERGCLGTIGELYEGDPPHRPCGAPAQAWSVAAMLEALSALETRAAARSRPESPPARKPTAADPV